MGFSREVKTLPSKFFSGSIATVPETHQGKAVTSHQLEIINLFVKSAYLRERLDKYALQINAIEQEYADYDGDVLDTKNTDSQYVETFNSWLLLENIIKLYVDDFKKLNATFQKLIEKGIDNNKKLLDKVIEVYGGSQKFAENCKTILEQSNHITINKDQIFRPY